MEQGPFRVHFIGIGGIGMSGIARILLEMGWPVSGSDLVASEKTESLAAVGVVVSIGHRAENVVGAKLVVVSSAVPSDNCEIQFARLSRIPVVTRAQMLGCLMRDRYGIAVAGTHGKTTTTSMLSLVLEKLGCDPSVVVGGEVFDIGGNGKLGRGPHLVVEADESDGSLLALPARIAVITNIEADHLDHYPDLDAIRAVFLNFMRQVPSYGTVVTCADDQGLAKLTTQLTCRHVDYGLQNGGLWQGKELEFSPFGSQSTIWRGKEKLGYLRLQVPGSHNVANALAVLAVAAELSLSVSDAISILGEFRGVARRFERIGESKDVLVIDDYAHHPTEVKATLAAARHLQRRIVAVFQPHRYSRVARLLEDFASCFFDADQLILTDIYPAGEKPITGISGAVLAEAVAEAGYTNVTYIPDKRDIPGFLSRSVLQGDVVLTLGAGNIRDVGVSFLRQQEEWVVSRCQEYESMAIGSCEALFPLAEQKTQS
ncbi:MAG: UDP-N-acetylmuramate--L-alanine ligase [Firmicutes bacterium]|nr:UDP-N-acetylmuramate--L-alanine ligase [Bacillota bacterium]